MGNDIEIPLNSSPLLIDIKRGQRKNKVRLEDETRETADQLPASDRKETG